MALLYQKLCTCKRRPIQAEAPICARHHLFAPPKVMQPF